MQIRANAFWCLKQKLTAVRSRVESLNKLFASFLMCFTLVPLTRMDRNRADVDDKTMAISLDSRTRETMRGRKCRAHCALSVRPTDARIPGARGALCFKTVARKQIRMVHVARISRPTVCLRVGYVGVDLYVDDPFPRIYIARTFHARCRREFPPLRPKGHGRIGNYATLLLGLRVARGINAISWREAVFNCVFHGVNVFTAARRFETKSRYGPPASTIRICNMSHLIELKENRSDRLLLSRVYLKARKNIEGNCQRIRSHSNFSTTWASRAFLLTF